MLDLYTDKLVEKPDQAILDEHSECGRVSFRNID